MFQVANVQPPEHHHEVEDAGGGSGSEGSAPEPEVAEEKVPSTEDSAAGASEEARGGEPKHSSHFALAAAEADVIIVSTMLVAKPSFWKLAYCGVTSYLRSPCTSDKDRSAMMSPWISTKSSEL